MRDFRLPHCAEPPASMTQLYNNNQPVLSTKAVSKGRQTCRQRLMLQKLPCKLFKISIRYYIFFPFLFAGVDHITRFKFKFTLTRLPCLKGECVSVWKWGSSSRSAKKKRSANNIVWTAYHTIQLHRSRWVFWGNIHQRWLWIWSRSGTFYHTAKKLKRWSSGISKK